MSAPTMPPVSEEPTARRPKWALPHGWWRWRPSWKRPGMPGASLLRQPWALGILAALWAALIGLLLAAVPMLILWLGDLEGGWVEPLRHAGLVWLVAQAAPVTIAGITITLLPWGLALIPVVLLAAAGAWSARRCHSHEPLALMWILISGAVTYTLVGVAVVLLASEPVARVDLLQAVLGCLVIAVLGLSWGVVRGARLLQRFAIPDVVSVTVRAGLLATAFIVGVGAIAATASLVVGIDDAITMTRSLGAGLGGVVGLVLLSLAYVPVMVVWGTSYILGAGVTLGTQAAVSPFVPSGAPVDLPPFPLLAALPQQAPPMAWALPALGIVAGVIAGALIGRRLRGEQRLVRLAAAGAAAVLAGAGLAVLAWLSSGSLGSNNLVDLGPDPSVLAVLTVILVLIGAVPVSVAPGAPERPALKVADEVSVTDSVEAADPDLPDHAEVAAQEPNRDE